jgi:hypothetical protein
MATCSLDRGLSKHSGHEGFQLFRLYGPLQPWFDQTWRLNEFESLD